MKTLIVEDSATLCVVYSQYLDGCGLDVMAVETLADASAALTEWAPELILLDIELPDGDGLELLNNADQMSHKPAVVVMTGHGSGHAERAIKQGAADFLEKPFDAARLRVTLLNSAEKLKLDRQVRRLSIKREHLGPLLGGSSAMQTVFDTVESLAGTVATALVMGESGTGKELVARAIHQLSARAPEPFVLVDCASLAPDQVERALFGTVETGYQGLVAQAKNGTLFLDEVCSLSYESQSTLLRLIQHGAYRPVGGEHEVAAEVFTKKRFSVPYLVGTMIELPRAALTAGEIAQTAEFFSFGTNDLTQTTYGISRDDGGSFVPEYIDKEIMPNDPFATLDGSGVGRLMEIACADGRRTRRGMKLGICGEHGGDPASIQICQDLGLDYVSCSPYRVPIARLAAAQAAIARSL